MIGAHCDLERCGELDLLPIKCPGCQRLFCRHHIVLSCHSCSSLENQRIDSELSEDPGPKPRRERCALSGCQKPTLESVIVDITGPERRVVATCPHCSGAFCAVWVVIYVYFPWALTFGATYPLSQAIVIFQTTPAKISHRHHLPLRRIPRPINSSRNTSLQRLLLRGHLRLRDLQSCRPTPRNSPGFVPLNS